MPQLWTTGDIPRRTRRPLPRAARMGLGLAVVGLLTSITAATLMSRDGSNHCGGEAVSTAAQVGFVFWLAAAAVLGAAFVVGLVVRVIQGNRRGTTSIFGTAIIGVVIHWLALLSTVQICF